MIDDIIIAIDLWFFENFASIKYIRKKCYLMMNLSKLTSIKKILSEVVVLSYNQVWSQICLESNISINLNLACTLIINK